MSAHKHWCQHGSWTCHAECTTGRALCGTCLGLGKTPTVACDNCGKDAVFLGMVWLCEECRDKIANQLEKGKFLG
jgi:predicted amidophosphoribosyltransferase